MDRLATSVGLSAIQQQVVSMPGPGSATTARQEAGSLLIAVITPMVTTPVTVMAVRCPGGGGTAAVVTMPTVSQVRIIATWLKAACSACS